jgi:hypothetical protein
MLREALKNGILVSLLILIGHYAIVNRLSPAAPATPAVVREPFPKAAPLTPERRTKEEDELFKWAYAEPSNPEENIDAYFKTRQRKESAAPPTGGAAQAAAGTTHQVVSEYVDENAMNGGALFAGLQGYNPSDCAYSSPLSA